MSTRTHPTAGLLPVSDRYGLWALSIRRAVSGKAKASGPHRRPLEALAATLSTVTLLTALHLLMFRAGGPAEVELWNLPLGFGFGILLGYGLGYLPILLAASVLAPIVGGVPIDPATVTAAASQTVVLVLGVLAVRWASTGAADDLTERRTFVAFFSAAPPAAALATLSAFVSHSLWSQTSGATAPAIFDVASFWSNLAGILMVGPVAIMMRRYISSALAGRRRRGRTGREVPGERWSYVWRGAIIAVSFGLSLYLVMVVPLSTELWYFAIISLPLVAAAWGLGLWGVAPVLGALGLAGVLSFVFGPELTSSMQFAAILAAANSSVLGLFVTEQRRYQGTMNHQAALIDSVSFATEHLLGMTDQEKNVNEVLEHLAREAHLDRVYVLENRGSTREASFPVLYEVGSDLGEEHRERVVALRGKYIRKSSGLLEDGQALQLTAADLPSADAAILRAAGIAGTLILPVFADDRWWGCLGMDQASAVSGWSRPDIATFEATARVLGALLAHTNVEQQFRQFTGSIPVVFWIASPDVVHKTYVSPAYEQIWGRPRDGIRENPRSWMAAIYHDDYTRISELLEGGPQVEFAEEYRIIRGDRSVRWIRDTGFPVVDATGQVNRIVGIAQDITPQKEAEEGLRASEEKIRTSLNEKEVLLKEIHHRVKNNLQVISSLLNLQAGKIHDDRAAQVFRESQYRVRAMALVHERLYQSEDLARIDFAGYVQDMTSHLLRSYKGDSRGIHLVSTVEGVSLDVDAAIPCALIINELVSNSLKYAFPQGQQGTIKVSLRELDRSIVMTISDDGIGLPEGTSFETSNSLGLQLVHSLTDQLGGNVVCNSARGTQFEIRFPTPERTS